MREPALESVLFLRPADPSPCLVYADWLSERGSHLEALGYRLLGGVVERDDELIRQLSLLAVACAVFALEATPFDEVVSSLADDEWLSFTDDFRSPHFGAHRAVEACAVKLGGDAVGLPLIPRGAAGLINEAASELIGSVFNGRSAWGQAAALARQAAPPALFLRAWRTVLSSLAANDRLPLSRDPELARSLDALSDTDLEPLRHQVLALEFPEILDGPPHGQVLSWQPGLTAGRAFTTTALHLLPVLAELEDFETLDLPLRREVITRALLARQRSSWQPLSLYRASWLLMQLAADNSGQPVMLGSKEVDLFDALDGLGPFTRGAVSLGYAPLLFCEFVRGWVLLEVQ